MKYYANREISWLAFNQRVLENASDKNVPLCERLNFFSIFQTNLDEFFMVRIGSLHDQQLLDNGVRENKTGMTPSRQIEAALNEIQKTCVVRDQIYDSLIKDLAEQNIQLVRFSEMPESTDKKLKKLFSNEIAPYLSCYKTKGKEKLPFLNNRDLYVVASIQDKKGNKIFAVVPCAVQALPRLVPVPEEPGRFALLEEFILHYLSVLFPKQNVVGKSIVRITRNADIDADSVYDEDLNYRDHMAEIVKQRKRLCPVRLELSHTVGTDLLPLLCDALNLSANQVFQYRTPLELSFLYQFTDMLRRYASLFYPPRSPRRTLEGCEEGHLIDTIQKRDLLLHYPYDSFNVFLSLIHEATRNPAVSAIRISLYRVARDSKVAEALAEAAESGKTVEVFVELKARFDEENNIEWSRRLESAGCKVTYGIEHIKVHSKLCVLLMKEESGKNRYITQIGTGNYNEKTSRIYTDFCLMTADQSIGQDGWDVFDALFQGTTVPSATRLLVSPQHMEAPLIQLINREIRKGGKGRIRLKLNSLTDKVLMEKLIEASCAGVRIDMVVRGICCLIPGIKGITENIRVISIVGRYLEHSRIYLFGDGQDLQAYISSADWMTRNMSRRVEIACPVSDPAHKRFLSLVLDTCMQDTAQSWNLKNDGTYQRRKPKDDYRINAQEAFYAYDITAGDS